ncbi:hypothetical protein E2562_025064 [Oryza meyeriana var. granulata]|uniref:RRM domain-containing protein n=1 Tax=Oryza meyeriana var. granulata TaxID=110450 RepID=A0A6G1D7L4_9ORYZ|nr:hypothetical protein E2562_025064 [Oryza meyeriana var. granulata]
MQGGSLPGSSTMWNEEVYVNESARALWHKIEKLEPRLADEIVHFTMRAKSSWQISWYAFSAADEEIQFLIDEAKSYMGLPPTQQLPQSPSLQPPSAWYESPSPYVKPQFQSMNIPGDGMPRDSLNAQVKVLGSGVAEMHLQRQSHFLGSQRDFLAHSLTDDGSFSEKFGPVIDVYIPYKPEPEKHTFSFVTFQNAETVRLLLSTPIFHSICGTEVRVEGCLERTRLEQRKLAQKNDQFDNVAQSCANAIEGYSGEKLRSYNELSQDFLKLRVSEKSGITNTIAPEIDTLLTHNLSDKETESPEGDHATKVSNVDGSSEFQDMEL